MNDKKAKNELVDKYHQLAFYRLDSEDGNKVYALKKAYHRRNILSRIQKCFSADERLGILEIGPGMGCLADLILGAFPQASYTVMDNNQGTLDELLVRFPDIEVRRVENESQLANASGKYDVIAAVDVWEHLPPESLVSYTRWCYESLKPNGIFILQFPNWGCLLTASTFYSDLTHVNRLNEKTVQQLFALVGIPEERYHLFNRRTPGLLGVIRDFLMDFFCIGLRLLYILFGSVRLNFFAADLVVVVNK
jgi:2-polyprenyl-3-methyl-5-hydroxy-6-metoxy-1,4-benzoquinol methylase